MTRKKYYKCFLKVFKRFTVSSYYSARHINWGRGTLNIDVYKMNFFLLVTLAKKNSRA